MVYRLNGDVNENRNVNVKILKIGLIKLMV